MRALFVKEFREQAPLGILVAGAFGAAWGSLASLGDYLGPGSEGFPLMAAAGTFAGTLLGLAPFELERWCETRAYLLHRATTARTVARTRMAASGAWAAIALAVSWLCGPVAHLGPAYGIEGYVGAIFSGLALASGMVLPCLGLGALAGTLEGPRWARWTAAFCGAVALSTWGGRLTSEVVVGSASGRLPYAAFLVVSGSALGFAAIGRFDRAARGARRASPRLRLAEGAILLGLAGVAWLLLGSELQFQARKNALASNENWTTTPDLVLRKRPSVQPGWFKDLSNVYERFEPSEGERKIFDCMYGGLDSDRWPQGRVAPLFHGASWQLGRATHSSAPVRSESWRVWFDLGLGKLIVNLSDERGRSHLFALGPASGAPRFETEPQVVATGEPGVARGDVAYFVLDPASQGIAALSATDAGPSLTPRELPNGDALVSVRTAEVQVEREGRIPSFEYATIFVGREGEYVFVGGEFEVPLAVKPSSDPPHLPIVVRYSAQDGIGYRVDLVDENSSLVLGSSVQAPGTRGERLAARWALAGTLLRAPLGSFTSHALTPDDPSGDRTPVVSLWIDPLVLGGRRPWLVVLHLCVAAALARSTRRRLGGRAWVWPLAVVLLGLPAWLVCRLLEPRTAARAVAERSSRRPQWAPIVDRATA